MLKYPETHKYSEAGKRSLSNLAKSRWANARIAASKLEGVKVVGSRITVASLPKAKPASGRRLGP
jgi:hypothetical protein